MKRILIATILLLGSVANSAYKEISIKDDDAATLNAYFEKIGTNRGIIASPDGSSSATRVSYGDEGGKIVCHARGVMNGNIVCKISADTGYKRGSQDPESTVRIDDSVPGQISIVIFRAKDVKIVAEALGAGEFASNAKAANGKPLVKLACGASECRLTFAN